MATIFYVHCPSCDGKFPCHQELWQVDYELLCPFCQTSFAQEESPMIISAVGERRPGSRASARGAGGQADAAASADPRPPAPASRPPEIDPASTAESM